MNFYPCVGIDFFIPLRSSTIYTSFTFFNLFIACVSHLCPKVAAAVAAGAVGTIKKSDAGRRVGQWIGEDDPLVCMNVSLTKTALNIAVCALPTDIAYNRCVCGFVSSLVVLLELLFCRM